MNYICVEHRRQHQVRRDHGDAQHERHAVRTAARRRARRARRRVPPGEDRRHAVGRTCRPATCTTSPRAAITRGTDSVWELYGEIELPLLRSVPGAEELTVNLSARYTDYQSYGGDTTYKIGALWSPVRAVSFRGAIGTSYRAPALFEQFVGATSGFLSQQGDPCNNWGAQPARLECGPELRERGPVAELPARRRASQSITIGGKDAGLEAETSKNKTFGVILQPQLAKGWGDFSFAVDYFDIQVDNGVDRIGTGNILSLCYDSPNFSSPVLPPGHAYRGWAPPRAHGQQQLRERVYRPGQGVRLHGALRLSPSGRASFRANALVTRYTDAGRTSCSRMIRSRATTAVIGAPKMTGVARLLLHVEGLADPVRPGLDRQHVVLRVLRGRSGHEHLQDGHAQLHSGTTCRRSTRPTSGRSSRVCATSPTRSRRRSRRAS